MKLASKLKQRAALDGFQKFVLSSFALKFKKPKQKMKREYQRSEQQIRTMEDLRIDLTLCGLIDLHMAEMGLETTRTKE